MRLNNAFSRVFMCLCRVWVRKWLYLSHLWCDFETDFTFEFDWPPLITFWNKKNIPVCSITVFHVDQSQCFSKSGPSACSWIYSSNFMHIGQYLERWQSNFECVHVRSTISFFFWQKLSHLWSDFKTDFSFGLKVSISLV
jgi:hypothetical protein